MLLTDRLLKELNLYYFARKGVNTAAAHDTPVSSDETSEPEAVQLNKDAFRLLVKMLQAINHELQTDLLRMENNVLTYPIANKTLVFDDVNLQDNDDQLHLASLTELLENPAVKRPVWEKLKTLQS